MTQYLLSEDDAKTKSIEDLIQLLQTSKDEGLKSSQIQERSDSVGLNKIEEKEKSAILKFLSYFWGPIPWMIEIAAILSFILHHWSNFTIILILLFVNGLVGFFEEFQASNAIAALKKTLSLKSIVKRDGKWIEIDSENLVPGDIIRLEIGKIIPADARLIHGEYLSVDQSALTGESLPVSKRVGDLIYSSSIAKQGEMDAIIVLTGKNTFFGKTAKLVEAAGAKSHFQKAILQIGKFLIVISIFLALLIILVQTLRGNDLIEIIQFVLVLIIASIPVAMPAVLSVTMALGAMKLSAQKAVVTKLESIEEIAGVDVLCSDKTGTLTQNKLKLTDPIPFGGSNQETLVLSGCLASKLENNDPIDLAIINSYEKKESLPEYTQTKFVPFDPTSKRSEATILEKQGKSFMVTKGAPQVILGLSKIDDETKKQAEAKIEELASKGFRTLGVARKDENSSDWHFLGLLPLSDPIREDSKETIEKAKKQGVQIKMLTGDNLAIAKEISSQLQLGTNILKAEKVTDLGAKIKDVDGFAEVFPEHKYQIIEALQKQNNIVAMTGDGVNDAPALKQADVGIAVSGATDAARSAASLVLTAPGLSVIITAIEEARRIFERMNSYSIYRIAETMRIMIFMTLCILIYDFYPITALMIILLALLNDLPIMTIVYDHTLLSKNPVHWKMKRVLNISSALGLIGMIETFFLIFLMKTYFSLTLQELQSLIFLKLSVAGHMTLFVARTRGAFFSKPYPSPILLTAILSTQIIAALIVSLGILVAPISLKLVGFVWIYAFVWMLIEDGVKNILYRVFKL